MKNLRVWNSAVLGGYALSLLLLAYFFFAQELRTNPYGGALPPEDFMLRFAAFWFVSFLLSIMVYLLNLSLNYLRLPRSEKVVAIQAGKLILAVGLFTALFAVATVMLGGIR